jgi:hypothetical protein
MDATVSGADGIAGRVFRERSTGARTDGAANCLRRNWPDGTRSGKTFGEAGADGEVVSFWRPKLASSLAEMYPPDRVGCICHPQGDGGKRARLTEESAK